jgi:outer membrane immunogenic protein
MNRIALAAFAAGSMAIASSAGAADLPIKAPYAAPVVWSWTGFYIGGHVGAGWGTIETETVGGGFVFSQGTVNGFLGGGQVGYNWQAGPIVLGVEADASATSIKGTSPCIVGIFVCKRNVDWMATFTGRVGFTADRALIYVKGGGAWADFKYTTSVAGLGIATAQQGQWGALVGAGVEYAFAPGWSAKLEYDYIDFGQRTVPFTIVAGGGGAVVNINATQNLHQVKFGVNYRFGSGPIAASY